MLRSKVCVPKTSIDCTASLHFPSTFSSHLVSQYPKAFEEYAGRCKIAGLDHYVDACRRSLVGTCVISEEEDSKDGPRARRYIASLITSLDYGKYVDTPAEIIENTHKAFQSLKDQILGINANNATKGIDSIDEVWAVRLNSGLFKVPWEETKAILEEKQEEEGKKLQNNIRIVYPPEKLRKKAKKRGFDYNEGTPVTPESDDPRPDDPSPDSPSPDDPSPDSPSPDDPSPVFTNPVTAYAKSVKKPRLRPSRGRMALYKMSKNKSTRGERKVSSGRVKKAKNRDRQGDPPSRLQVERTFTEKE